MIRRAENVTLSRTLFGRVTVHVGKNEYTRNRKAKKEEWAADRARQLNEPVLILSTADRNLWQFQGRFYWDNDRLNDRQVQALLVTRSLREHQRIERAQAVVAMGSLPRGHVRGAIPDDLRQYVWSRDEGRCRNCGNQHELQYDHIIPVSMGGATTAENLQILCGPCNRRKGAGLTNSAVGAVVPNRRGKLAAQAERQPSAYPTPEIVQGAAGVLRTAADGLRSVNDPSGTISRFADTLVSAADVMTPANTAEVADIVRGMADSLREDVNDPSGAFDTLADTLTQTADLLQARPTDER